MHSGYWKTIEPRCQKTMLSTDEEKAETLELTRGDRKEYQYFGLGVENETSRRLSTLLDETHLKACPDEAEDANPE